MCISPIRVLYNGKKLYLNNHTKLVNSVPCGKCYECRKEKTNQLMVRAYFDESDYYLFDTLTYSEDNVPLYEGIRVLKYSDYQKFMKRLRYYVSCVDSQCKMKYIVSGEYGSSENGTHRPHYHIILGVKKDDIVTPVLLSRLIKKAWQFGITDGVDDKGIVYFNENRVFRGLEAKKNIVGYICKYVTKSNDYENMLIRIIKRKIIERFKKFNCTLTYQQLKNDANKIIKEYKQFVRWSHGFGEEFIFNDEEIRKFEKSGYINIMTDLRGNKYKIPLYYKRKLYQYQNDDKQWLLNKKGVEFEEIKLKKLYQYNIKLLKLYEICPDKLISKVAFYWTYRKDRLIKYKKAYVRPQYTGPYFKCENTNNDRMVYVNGLIKIHGSYKKFDSWLKMHIFCNEKYDMIIEKTLKKRNEQFMPFIEDEEKTKEIKKNLKKMLYVLK